MPVLETLITTTGLSGITGHLTVLLLAAAPFSGQSPAISGLNPARPAEVRTRSINEPQTFSDVDWQPIKASSSSEATDVLSGQAPAVHGFSATPNSLDPDLEYVAEEIAELSSYKDGWKGPSSRGAPQDATEDVKALISQIAQLGNPRALPMIGLDEDGIYCLTWHEGDLLGNLTVRGNGTYSYSIRRGHERYSNSRALIGRPMDENLVRALSV